MKHLDLLNEFRTAMAELSAQVEASSAMQLYDIHKVSENLLLGTLRELLDLRNLRNLNATERVNFPGIDLADDVARVAVQVTATASLDKVTGTIEKFLRHRLTERFDRLIVYILARKQGSYSQDAVRRAAQGQLNFRTNDDILDFRDLCGIAANVDPARLAAALQVVRSYSRGGIAQGLSPEDFNPPAVPCERAVLNVVEIYFPQTLYLADVREDIGTTAAKRNRNQRKSLREACVAMNLRTPSDYEVNAGQVVTFHALDDPQGPFANVIEHGTVTPVKPKEYFGGDEAQERVFKSLLRFTLQQKLYKHRVQWMHEDGLFVFLPREEGDLLREEAWIGQRSSSRRVYERKLNKKDPSKTFICKHLAFSVEFIVNAGLWYVSIVPDWYFSFGDGYRRSAFADASVSWLKRREVNRTVFDHFRFLTAWLNALDGDDLFASAASPASALTFGEAVAFANHPPLDDEAWLPLRDTSSDEEPGSIRELFDLE